MEEILHKKIPYSSINSKRKERRKREPSGEKRDLKHITQMQYVALAWILI